MEIIVETNKVYILDESNNIIGHVIFDNVTSKIVCISETKVDPILQGQGVASQLMNAAYNAIKENNFKTIMTCSYAYSWFLKHPEKQDILAKPLEECACDIKGCSL